MGWGEEVRLYVVTRARDRTQLGLHRASWMTLTQRLALVGGSLAGSGAHAKRVLTLAEAEAYWLREGHHGSPPLHGL